VSTLHQLAEKADRRAKAISLAAALIQHLTGDEPDALDFAEMFLRLGQLVPGFIQLDLLEAACRVCVWDQNPELCAAAAKAVQS
jgi:hypothetical protein